MVVIARPVLMAPPSAPEMLRRELAEARRQIDDLTDRMERLEERSCKMRKLQNEVLVGLPKPVVATRGPGDLTSPPPPSSKAVVPLQSPVQPSPTNSERVSSVILALAAYMKNLPLLKTTIRKRRNLRDICVVIPRR
eukprot:TRINITY_DN2759_c0_g1_i1.p1 TRINITY_DN2759_c0_g1~~TRINITY_DN2759_c0_g1_i1.p1  ORF type:complete len:137 (+),score=23.06 TRINITY_DN2759_c0_g1_i1:64-474(+)